MFDQDQIFINDCVSRFRHIWAGDRWDRMFSEATADRVERRIRDDLNRIVAFPQLSLVRFDIDCDGNPPDPCIDIIYHIREDLEGTMYTVVTDERPRGKCTYEIMRDDDKTDKACTAEGKAKPRTIEQAMNRIFNAN